MKRIKNNRRGIHKIIVFFMLAISMTACGGGGSNSGGGTGDSSEVELSGNWVGHGGSSVYQGQGDIRMTIKQSGDNVNGTVSITNLSLGTGTYICGNSTWDFSGSINGNNLTFEQATPAGKTVFDATVSNNKISGTYRTLSGPCRGDRGTFSLTRE